MARKRLPGDDPSLYTAWGEAINPTDPTRGYPMPGDPQIGLTGDPAQAEAEKWLEAIPRLAPLAGQLQGTIEGSYPGGEDPWSEKMIRGGVSELMGGAGGMSQEEELAAQQRVQQGYQSAVAGAAMRGAAGGAYSPRAVQRVAVREAGQTLAPAMAGLEAEKAKRQLEARRMGLQTMTQVYPYQAAAQQQRRQEYGELLGRLLKGPLLGGGAAAPAGQPTPAPGVGIGAQTAPAGQAQYQPGWGAKGTRGPTIKAGSPYGGYFGSGSPATQRKRFGGF
jgi:hypothetical protein